MYRKIVLLALASMLLLLAMFGARIAVPVSASERHVYFGESIQEAINLAYPGDTIFVHNGTYYEHLEVNKTVSLIGENRSTTIIDGNGTWQVIRVRASNVEIRGFTIQNGGNLLFTDCGIFIGNWTGNTISNNIIRGSYDGLYLLNSKGNKIVDNIIVDNSYAGMYISASNNSIFGNTIAYNFAGAWIASSPIPNTFHHNNFLNNTNQVRDLGPSKWDNGTEGNYWSDYTGVDEDGDGIGETPYLGDQFPLIIPTRPFPVIWDDVIYPVAVLSNSTVSRFYFNKPSKEIGFYVTGLSNTTGFCNVTIPKKLLRDNPWTVKVDNKSIPYIPSANTTHSSLYFTYNHSAQRIRIIGTQVVPEFPTAILLPLLIIVTLVVVTLRKRGASQS